ncbi:MAG: phytanoyl-CoA dioxygenase family protein [Planctomycetota bacterium]|nr:phytanoyl-CoA dioxygenase family protein [Planctomycetota bacterium]
MKLTPQQVAFFNTFGYLGIPNFFTPEETAAIIEEFEWAIQHQGGQNHDGSRRTMFGGPIEHRARQCAILDMPKVKGLIGGAIGDDFSYTGGDGNYYSGDTGWHPDGSWGRLFAVKVAFYLDPLTRDTGCLRVIPGSHRPDHYLRKDQVNPNNAQELFGLHPRDFPGNVALETQPGDILMFNHDTYHAAFGGSTRRRMFTMNCIRHAHTPEDLAVVRHYVSIHSAGGYNLETGAGAFFPAMVHSANESRWTHLRQVAEMHDSLYPHLAPKNLGKVKIVRREVSALVPPAPGIPLADATLPGPTLAFQPANPEHFGLLSVRKIHEGNPGLVYVRVVFRVEHPCQVTIHYGTDAPTKVWLNGETIETRADAAGPLAPAQFQVTHAATDGENEAVFAVDTRGGKAAGVIPAFVVNA